MGLELRAESSLPGRNRNFEASVVTGKTPPPDLENLQECTTIYLVKVGMKCHQKRLRWRGGPRQIMITVPILELRRAAEGQEESGRGELFLFKLGARCKGGPGMNVVRKDE